VRRKRQKDREREREGGRGREEGRERDNLRDSWEAARIDRYGVSIDGKDGRGMRGSENAARQGRAKAIFHRNTPSEGET